VYAVAALILVAAAEIMSLSTGGGAGDDERAVRPSMAARTPI
jgi:hypothetical protein